MAHVAALLVVELVLTVELVELLLAIELTLATELRIELDVVVAEELDAMDVVALELELGIGVSLGVLFTPPPPQPVNSIVRLADSNREDNFIFSVLFMMGELWASNFSLLNDRPAFYGFFAQDCSRAIDRPWC